MTKRVADLQVAELDKWVAHAHGMMLYHEDWQPSRNWSQGGPLIEQAYIAVVPYEPEDWAALYECNNGIIIKCHGRTPLEAAMRCYVTSRLGEEVSDEG